MSPYEWYKKFTLDVCARAVYEIGMWMYMQVSVYSERHVKRRPKREGKRQSKVAQIDAVVCNGQAVPVCPSAHLIYIITEHISITSVSNFVFWEIT
jgi:hypothetical protein